ncbi:nucleotidyltransferase domain-containing protein [Candidatus Pacearchaeota archaeon]|nr:nucleotidyltransferase domain-containing protein [Candidatus Pacearchaeota archaeon]
MNKKTNQILKEIINQIKPAEEELNEIKKNLNDFLKILKKEINIKKINVDIFVGGSFAKNTLIKKERYDIDIFLRFNKKYKKENISKITSEILSKFKNCEKIHGSRDYFRINVNENLFFEIIPTIQIKKPEEAENITDLSFFHVKYIKRKANSKKILEDIMIAKAFCQAKNCYGAESYIKGFSGYSLELLVYYYKGFEKFLKEISKIKTKEIIDIEKLHKNKSEILMNLNSSKLQSPIILIDPTYKQRNALAALSEDTLKKFQKECKKFLKKPSKTHFEKQKTNINKIMENTRKKKLEFILLEAKTDKQKGDIAGGKLLKFYNHLSDEISYFFKVTNKGFNYNEKNSARFFFVAKNKKEIISEGPEINDKKNIKKFKKVHKNCFIKNNRIYSKEKINFNFKKYINDWKRKNKKKMSEMHIKDLKIVE